MTTTTQEHAEKFHDENWHPGKSSETLMAEFADSLTAELQKENAKLAAGLRKWELALQSLTPGGSEYVGDPERCAACVRRSTESRWEFTKKTKIERDELQKENARLRLFLIEADDIMCNGGLNDEAFDFRTSVRALLSKEKK